MKSRDIIFKEVRKIISEILEKKESKIFEDSSLADLGMDSLDVSNLMIEINEHFKIDLKHENLSIFTTMAALIDLIESILIKQEI